MTEFPYKIVDLTHALNTDTPTFDGGCGFNHKIVHDYDPASEYQFRTNSVECMAGIGTHIDSPLHCFGDGISIDRLDLNNLVTPCIVIDISDKANASYKLSADDVLAFEKAHGTIKSGSFAIIRTGWEKYWNEPEKYRNDLVFPSVSKEAAALLLERGVTGIGIDTLSSDIPEEYPVHKLMLGSGKHLVENIANSDKLPPVGAFSFILPIKIENGAEAPVRMIGLIPVSKENKS